MNINDIYSTKEEALYELKKRWKDQDLKKKVEKYLNNDIPPIFLKEPCGICTSHVASPNEFFSCFYRITKESGLKPVVFEYLDDIFITTNFDKASLAKMIFISGVNKNGKVITKSKQIIDLSGKNEKKKIRELRTTFGKNFVDFHHDIVYEFFKDTNIYDGSNWYHKMGKKPIDYYKYILALYIRNGILFENYILNDKNEKKFIEDVLIPAFLSVKKEFNLKPLIVPVSPMEEECDKKWWCYSKKVKDFIDKNH